MKIWAWWLSALAVLIFLTGILLVFLGSNGLFFSINGKFLTFIYALLPKQSIGPHLWWGFTGFGILSIVCGIFLLYVALFPFKKVEKWAWLAVFITVMIWFTIGASMSILFLIYVDMILYSMVLILALLPLLFTQKAFIIRRDLL